MIVLHDMMVAYLSGLAEEVDGEIFWENVSIKLLDAETETYIYSEYDSNKIKRREMLRVGETVSGKACWWDSRGRLVAESLYKDGLLNGTSISFNTDGTIRKKSIYKDGKLLDIIYDSFA